MIDRESWDKQKGETSKAFEAFSRYRDLGATRSMQSVAQMYAEETGRKATTVLAGLKRWSSKYDWVQRAEDWDVNQDRIYQAENKQKLKAMRERHLTYEAVKQQKGFEKLREIDTIDLDAKEALALLDSGIRGERTLHGEPESTLGISGEGVRKIKLKWIDEMGDDENE